MFLNFRKKNCFDKKIRQEKKDLRDRKKEEKENEKNRLALERKVQAEARLKRKEVQLVA